LTALAISESAIDSAVTAVLDRFPNISFAIIFKSVAYGRPRIDSDLDIAVAATRKLEVSEKIALTQALAEATGRPIDLLDLATVTELLLGQILQYGRRLLGTDTQFSNLIYRRLVDEADFRPTQRKVLTERFAIWLGK
jgi:predicted nucleotidyltransferase